MCFHHPFTTSQRGSSSFHSTRFILILQSIGHEHYALSWRITCQLHKPERERLQFRRDFLAFNSPHNTIRYFHCTCNVLQIEKVGCTWQGMYPVLDAAFFLFDGYLELSCDRRFSRSWPCGSHFAREERSECYHRGEVGIKIKEGVGRSWSTYLSFARIRLFIILNVFLGSS